MATRFKSVENCDWVQTGPSQGDGYNDCYNVEVPIRDWEIVPQSVNTNYTKGGAIPQMQVNIVFPELSEWNRRTYDNIYYDLSVSYQGNAVEWLDFKSKDLQGKSFTKVNIEQSSVDLVFKNLALLPAGLHTATILIKAYEQTRSGRTFVEDSPAINVNLEVRDNTSVNAQHLRPRNITYNKSTRSLTGEIPIVIDNPTLFDSVEESPYYNFSVTKTNSQITIQVTPKEELSNLNAGLHGHSIRLFKNLSLFFGFVGKLPVGDIPLVVNVMENANTPATFSVAPTDFNFTLSKNMSETKEGSAQIYNPRNLNIQVGAVPSFLENVRIEHGELKFRTKNSSNLVLGLQEGDIVLRSGSIAKKVHVVLKVIQSLDSDFKGSAYYFALDDKKVSMTKTNPLATYATMRLEMYYKGYDEEYRDVQEYSQHYYQDKIIFVPGEEVQDFFIKCKKFKEIEDFQYQYGLASVNIIIKEYDAHDKELSESRLDNIFFAPGKTPKCFPIFTDFGKRRTYSNSKIRLNTDAISEKSIINDLFEKYTKQKPSVPRKFEVWAYHFDRDKFQSSEEKNLLLARNLTFIPFPNPRGNEVAHLFFENQNLVLDWFTCPIEHRRKFDFTHIVDENNGEKFGALETETLVLNTGWILREEVELINSLIKSRICFIIIDGEVIKARPISKKNEIYNTAENLFSMDLEFNIKQNER